MCLRLRDDLYQHRLLGQFVQPLFEARAQFLARQESGVAVRPEYVREGTHSRHVARSIAEELLRLPNAPTAIFAASDTQALGVLEKILKKNILFDPYAPESARRQQLAALREQLERKAG